MFFLEKKEIKSQDFFLTVEHSLIINMTDILSNAELKAQVIIGYSKYNIFFLIINKKIKIEIQ